MKKYNYLLAIITALLVISCEDVIKADLTTAAPRLVVNGSLKWQKGTLGNEQKIKLSTTTGFYDTVIPTVSGALILVTNSNNDSFNFTEEVPNSGVYLCHNFIPEINQTYVINLVLNGDTYTATETLKSVSPITSVMQYSSGGFSGTDVEIKTYYTDPANSNDYYLFKYKSSLNAIPLYQVSEDKFYQGNQFFGYYTNGDIKTGDNLDITIYGVSKRYFDYMSKLILISGANNGPFSTPPATVRGNIINQTHPNNYALGYFNVSETDFRNYIIQ